jgi:hypothetical protein
MKTEVPKVYKNGFTLSEVELRRIVQTCQEHMLKQIQPQNISTKLTATLLDGSIIETPSIDDILALENSGSRQVKKTTLEYTDEKDPPEYQISLTFQNADKVASSWVSIRLNVVGQTRDWAFLAAADIDERLKKVKQLSSSFIVNSRLFLIVPIIISFAVMFLVLPPSYSYPLAIDKLEAAYKSGTIKDPIEAMIFLERAKNDPSTRWLIIPPMILTFGAPWIFIFGLGKLFSIIAPAYNFYWGDYVSYYDKRRSAQNVFWTVVVLGIIVSVISAYIMRFLP